MNKRSVARKIAAVKKIEYLGFNAMDTLHKVKPTQLHSEDIPGSEYWTKLNVYTRKVNKLVQAASRVVKNKYTPTAAERELEMTNSPSKYMADLKFLQRNGIKPKIAVELAA